MTRVRLDQFDNRSFDRGRSRLVELLWLLVRGLVFNMPLPLSGPRCWVLRRFGAHVGTGVVMRSGVRIKFPWKLKIGDHSWIGESVWIDNLAPVSIGAHCCVSQGAYLCTGNHDWVSPRFDLRTDGIVLHDGGWIAAMARVGPGVTIGSEAIVGFGACAVRDVDAHAIVAGNPARVVGRRIVEPVDP